MQFRKKPEVDVIRDVLEAMLVAKPDSVFIRSLNIQYEERGGLSKKQLEGLYQKALKVPEIPAPKLATLEAEILKRPNRYKSSVAIEVKPLYTKDEKAGELIQLILSKYPAHKRVLFLQVKYNNNETLTPAEIQDLERFAKLIQ